MRISTDVLQTLDTNGIDVSSAWLWVDADSYDSSYRQVLEQPISLEAITLDFLRWKVSTVTLTIRTSNLDASDVMFAGEAALIDDSQGTVAGNHNDLQNIYGESPFYHLDAVSHSLVTSTAALTGTGLLELTSGIPSLIGIGSANGLCGLGSDSRVAWTNLPASLSGAVHYAGTWDASTNTPTLPDPTTNNGAYYIVSAAGSYSGIVFAVGDACISNGTDYEKIDNTQLVTSVFGRVGAVVAAATDYSSYYPRLDNTYTDPSWIGSLAWSKISGKPSTLSGYGIASTDTLFDTKYLGINANVASASKLAAARTISMTGDGTWSTSFDGSANVTGKLTLATLLTAGSAGSATAVPTLTWDAKGRLTAVGSAAISISHTQISDWSTATSSFLTANQSISLTGAVTGSGTTSIATSFANTHLARINQDLTTASSPTFGGITAINSYYGVFGIATADAQKWYLVATVDITAQYGFASAVIRFNSVGNSGASGLWLQCTGSCFIRAKQQSSMSNGLDNFAIGWNYCHGFNPSSAVIGVKTTDNASHKIVNIYLLCPASYEGMSWQIDNLNGSITASGVGTNYVTTLPTGLATYTGASAIWSDWTNITIPGASTFTGLITANGGISGNLTGHASLDLPLTGGTLTGSLYGIGGFNSYAGSSSSIYRYVGSLPYYSSAGNYTEHLKVEIIGSVWSSPGGIIARFNCYGGIPQCVIEGYGSWVPGFVAYLNSANSAWDFYYAPTSNIGWVAYGIISTLAANSIRQYSGTELAAKSTTSPTGTLTTISTSTWINQPVSTTSSPTFNYLTLTNRLQINSSQWGAGISQDGLQGDVIGYYSTWDANKLFINTYNNGVGYGAARFSGVYLHGILTTPEGISTTTLTASGLITANGGISGNLTGHASLDIPLTGSSAITGVLASSNRANFGTLESPWGDVHTINLYAAGAVVAQGQLTALAIGSTLGMSSGGSLTVAGNTTLNGALNLAVNLQSSPYTITRADQGKMVVSNGTLNLPSLTDHDAGFWCLVNWHVGGGSAVFGPTTSGTTWILRGQYVYVSTSTPFTGVVSWDGYTWYAG